MIRERFPLKKFPMITMEQVNFDGPMMAASMSFLPSSNKVCGLVTVRWSGWVMDDPLWRNGGFRISRISIIRSD